MNISTLRSMLRTNPIKMVSSIDESEYITYKPVYATYNNTRCTIRSISELDNSIHGCSLWTTFRTVPLSELSDISFTKLR
jgi:hypothetical protein